MKEILKEVEFDEKIKEMIVVEGKNDTSKLKTFFDCDTIETGGDHVSKEVLDRIEAAANRRGIIVFTDPDTAGEHIRRLIKERIPEAKHAFIAKSKAKTDKKSVLNMQERKILRRL